MALDDRGRVRIPQVLRSALGLVPGAKLTVAVESGEIRLQPVIERYKIRVRRRWGREAFLCAGEAAFAGDESAP